MSEPCIFCGCDSDNFAAYEAGSICDSCYGADRDEHGDRDEPTYDDEVDGSEALLADLERDDPDFWEAMRS